MQRKCLTRSSTYRYDYTHSFPPKHDRYMCRYCGKWIRKEEMEVDHIISIHKAKHNLFYRMLIKEDVNELANLAPTCKSCNNKKSEKGGLWVLRGKLWKICLPIYMIIRIIAAIFLLVIVFALFDYTPAVETLMILVRTAKNFLIQVY